MGRAKFFDGQVSKSQAAIVKISDGQLVIARESDGAGLDVWLIKDLKLDPRTPNVPTLMSLHEPDARLELIDIEILKNITALNPNLKFRAADKRTLLWLAGILIFMVGLLFLSAVPIADYVARQIPFTAEKKLADKIDLSKQLPTCPLDAQQEAALNRLVKSVFPASPADRDFEIAVRIVKTSEVNAFALPGGIIIINQGLLMAANSPEEVAGVLAHEIGHVKNRHILQSLVRGALFTSALNFISGNVSQILVMDPSTLVNLVALRFDRKMESEADQAAIERLTVQKISLRGYSDFFDRDVKKWPAGLAFLSTHPPDNERIALIKRNLLPLENPRQILNVHEWDSLKKVCTN